MKIKLALLICVLLTTGIPAHAAESVLVVEGKAVVFFGPSDQEYQAVPESEKYGWDETLSDFYYYGKKTFPYLESNRIQPLITANTTIRIHAGDKVRTFVRKNFKHAVGYIMTDGNKEPKVIEGVGTDADLITDFKEYFALKESR